MKIIMKAGIQLLCGCRYAVVNQKSQMWRGLSGLLKNIVHVLTTYHKTSGNHGLESVAKMSLEIEVVK